MNDIIFAKTDGNDIYWLKKLWADVFDEKQEAVNLIFDNYSDLFNAYCAKKDSKIIAALYLVDGSLNGQKAHYLCGAATMPEYRKQGIMSKLIEYALNDAAENGDKYSLLLPASDSLYSYYSRFGYVADCGVKRLELTRNQLESGDFGSSLKENQLDFENLQKKCFNCNFFMISQRFFDFSAKYYKAYGASLLRNENCFALVDIKDSRADIIYCVYANFNDLKSLLLGIDAEKFVITCNASNVLFTNLQTEKYGMIKLLDKSAEIPNDVYIGITLQ